MYDRNKKSGTPSQDRITKPVGSTSGPVIPVSSFKDAHTQSDVDSEPSAQHHTLGLGGNQAAPGSALKRILSRFNGVKVLTIAMSGAWGTAVPGVAAGQTFTLDMPSAVGFTFAATAYNTVAAAMTIEVWLDGVNTGVVMKLGNSAINAHLRLMDGIWYHPSLPAGTHYVYYRIIAGISDGNDFGNVYMNVIPN